MQVVLKRKNINNIELAKALIGVMNSEGIAHEVLENLKKSEDHNHDEPIPEKYIRSIVSKMNEEFNSLLMTLFRNIDKWFAYVSRKGKSFLRKAENEPPPLLSQEQIDELKMLIESHFRAAIGIRYNIPKDLQKRWAKAGIEKPDEDLETWIRQAYVAGRLADVLTNSSTYAEMVRMVKKLPLSRMDRLVLDAAKQNAAKYIKSCGVKFGDVAEEVILNNNKSALHDIVQGYFSGDLKHTTYNAERLSPEEVQHLLSTDKQVKGWRELSTELKNRFKAADMSRDWDRVAVSEIRYATNLGRLVNIQVEGGGDPDEIDVYYHVQPTACKYCKELYLEPDGTPKIFKLSEILRNVQETGGMQIGLKASRIGEEGGWVPNALAHPFCHCYMVRYIKGYKMITPVKDSMKTRD
ncbi:hypothetical protein LSG31_00500 [Fodinisporobacter ferrooxydans]|uniref:Phage head morphogenesis domain-containing protein n=1 Tax=Fodinisporobacter ferrooxydans TaxID=2901836 RepID=A0ABY4CNM7_9BACL|nr:hypothetical protein LSG31_00500 [Alicyclobacillaceae bacterium MYW30-H2]